jgi:hypothetical protein
MSLKLAKKGYYNSDPRKVLEARVDDVMNIYNYENFISDFEDTYYEMNKG